MWSELMSEMKAIGIGQITFPEKHIHEWQRIKGEYWSTWCQSKIHQNDKNPLNNYICLLMAYYEKSAILKLILLL